jgi:hypothetical protein
MQIGNCLLQPKSSKLKVVKKKLLKKERLLIRQKSMKMSHNFRMIRCKQSLVIKKIEIYRTCRKKHKKKMWISANRGGIIRKIVR